MSQQYQNQKAKWKEQGRKEALADEIEFLESKEFMDMIHQGDYECSHAVPLLINERLSKLKENLGNRNG